MVPEARLDPRSIGHDGSEFKQKRETNNSWIICSLETTPERWSIQRHSPFTIIDRYGCVLLVLYSIKVWKFYDNKRCFILKTNSRHWVQNSRPLALGLSRTDQTDKKGSLLFQMGWIDERLSDAKRENTKENDTLNVVSFEMLKHLPKTFQDILWK